MNRWELDPAQKVALEIWLREITRSPGRPRGNLSKAALMLGIDPSHLSRVLHEPERKISERLKQNLLDLLEREGSDLGEGLFLPKSLHESNKNVDYAGREDGEMRNPYDDAPVQYSCKGCDAGIEPGERGLEFSIYTPLVGLVHFQVHDDFECLKEAAVTERGSGRPETAGAICYGCELDLLPGQGWMRVHNGRRWVWVHDDEECLKEALGARGFEA